MRHLQSRFRDTKQISRGKFNRLPCTAAESTLCVLDGNGLRDHRPARPTLTPHIRFLSIGSHPALRDSTLPSDPALRRRPCASLTLHPARRDWVEDFHLQAVEHARHTGWRRHRLLCRRPSRSQDRPWIGGGDTGVARVRGAHTSKTMYAPPASEELSRRSHQGKGLISYILALSKRRDPGRLDRMMGRETRRPRFLRLDWSSASTPRRSSSFTERPSVAAFPLSSR